VSLLEVRGLVKEYPRGRGRALRALRGVDLDLEQGQVLGLVGESGCGKSTLGRCILRLDEPSAGQVFLDGVELTGMSRRALRRIRPRMQPVFQDPFLSLDPRLSVADIVEEPLRVHGRDSADGRRAHVRDVLEQVGLGPGLLARYPHELSGGQRQRVGIARALVLDPQLVVADEPVSALDVSVQAQILNLLLALQKSRGLSLLLISHDLRVVRTVSDRVAVMYLGRIVERGPPQALATGLHPYSRALAAAVPRLEGANRAPRLRLSGEVPSALDPPPGCPFHPRCSLYAERGNPACIEQRPPLTAPAPGHEVACHEVETG